MNVSRADVSRVSPVRPRAIPSRIVATMVTEAVHGGVVDPLDLGALLQNLGIRANAHRVTSKKSVVRVLSQSTDIPSGRKVVLARKWCMVYGRSQVKGASVAGSFDHLKPLLHVFDRRKCLDDLT